MKTEASGSIWRCSQYLKGSFAKEKTGKTCHVQIQEEEQLNK